MGPREGEMGPRTQLKLGMARGLGMQEQDKGIGSKGFWFPART